MYVKQTFDTTPKGHVISERNLGVYNFPKKTNEILVKISALA